MYRFVKGFRKFLLGAAVVASIIAVMVIDNIGLHSGLFMVGGVASLWISYAITDSVFQHEKALRAKRRAERVRIQKAEETRQADRRRALVSRADQAFDDVA
jgi:hypothetical protein